MRSRGRFDAGAGTGAAGPPAHNLEYLATSASSKPFTSVTLLPAASNTSGGFQGLGNLVKRWTFSGSVRSAVACYFDHALARFVFSRWVSMAVKLATTSRASERRRWHEEYSRQAASGLLASSPRAMVSAML